MRGAMRIAGGRQFTRRVGVFLIGGLLWSAVAATPVLAGGAWDGTWGGASNGSTLQVIVVGSDVIGVYWGDYVDGTHGKVSPDGRTLTATWPGGKAVLVKKGAATAVGTVTAKGHAPIIIALKRD